MGKVEIFTTRSYFEKQFHAICSRLRNIFRAIFNTHAYWQSTLLPTQYTYSLSASVSHHLGTKKPSWCSAYQMLAQRGAPPNMLSLLCSLTPKIKGLSSYD